METKKRAEQNQQEKYVAFKIAFDTFTRYLNDNNLIGAYVVAFSILEDRINAAYLLLQDLLQHERPAVSKHTAFAKKIKALNSSGFIQITDCNLYLACAYERNRKLHAAMWNLNEFSTDDCLKVIKFARAADNLSRKLKKLAIKNEKTI